MQLTLSLKLFISLVDITQ